MINAREECTVSDFGTLLLSNFNFLSYIFSDKPSISFGLHTGIHGHRNLWLFYRFFMHKKRISSECDCCSLNLQLQDEDGLLKRFVGEGNALERFRVLVSYLEFKCYLSQELQLSLFY